MNNILFKKVCIICTKGTLEDVYATLALANGAVVEGIETKVFFTFLVWMQLQKRLNKIPSDTFVRGTSFPNTFRLCSVCGGVGNFLDEKRNGET